jgi:arabinogalactan endo-1,4-beta-galactosidase
MTEINPDIIQIGNEINSGLLCHKEIWSIKNHNV